jgi:hypothetical protein
MDLQYHNIRNKFVKFRITLKLFRTGKNGKDGRKHSDSTRSLRSGTED